jgi:hypothetical protein
MHVCVGDGAEEVVVENVVDGTDELEVPGKLDDDDDTGSQAETYWFL